MMHRNLDRRVEALIHITDPAHIEQFDRQLSRGVSDEMQSWRLETDGTWTWHGVGAAGDRLGDVQNDTMIDIFGRKRSGVSR
jgi:polyphosphate kinase